MDDQVIIKEGETEGQKKNNLLPVWNSAFSSYVWRQSSWGSKRWQAEMSASTSWQSHGLTAFMTMSSINRGFLSSFEGLNAESSQNNYFCILALVKYAPAVSNPFTCHLIHSKQCLMNQRTPTQSPVSTSC